jgi:putative multiple sugar transport system substrate-binding protein
MNKWTKVIGLVAATAMLIPLAACGNSRGGGHRCRY